LRLVTAWNRFWFAPGQAEDLAISRILFAGGMFLFAWSRPVHEWGDVPEVYLRPARFFQPLGIPIAGSGLLQVLEIGWLAAIFSLTIGLLTRTSAAIVCVGSLYLFGIDAPELLGRAYTPAVFLPAILALSRSGDVLSVDAWRRRRQGRDDADERRPEEYGWPAKLVCVLLSYMFFAAGVSKIRITGFPDWMLSEVPYQTLLLGNYWYASRVQAPLPVGAALLRINDGFAIVVGVVTQFSELLYPLALFVRAARLTVVPVMLAILAGIAVAMGPFFPLTMLAHVFWVPWTRVLRRASDS
jgi:hypothetical protein